MIKKYSYLKNKSSRKTGTGEIEVEVGDYIVNAQVIVKIEVDSNYGADADGNRGIYAQFIADWDFVEDPLVFNQNTEEYVPFKSLKEEEQDTIVAKIDKNIEFIKLEPEYDDGGPDYDDVYPY